MLSLEAKDRKAAKRLIPARTAATDRLLDEARTQMAHRVLEKAAQEQAEYGEVEVL